MGNSQTQLSVIEAADATEKMGKNVSTDDFTQRWQHFLNSLDISSARVRHVESLDHSKKLELLNNFEAKNQQYPISHCVSMLKHFDWGHLMSKSLKKGDPGSALRSLLSSTDISLRTNSVDWVYEFLKYDGLDILTNFISTCLDFLFWYFMVASTLTVFSPDEIKGNSSFISQSPRGLFQISSSRTAGLTYGRTFLDRSYPSPTSHGTSKSDVLTSDVNRASENHIICAGNFKQTVPCHVKDLLRDCVHLSLRCLKTIFNNQRGCKRAFEHTQAITVVTFSLLHPNFGTKALALDILTALCLIEGGHVKVLQAFDRLRHVMSEGLRFELLLDAFKVHESLDLEKYNIEFAVACVQFFNIVVHSPENINLRVYLQYELYLLGLDDTLKQLRSKAGDRLMQHIEAYLENRVDCSLLLEDAEAKEMVVAELERLEADCNSRFVELKEAARAEAEVVFKARELELSELVESLRTRIRDLNVSSFDREKIMKCHTEDLTQALKASQTEVVRLQTILASVRTTPSADGSDKFGNPTATSTNFDFETRSTSKECLPTFGDQYQPCPVYLSSHSNSVDKNSPRDPLLSTQSTDHSLSRAFDDVCCSVNEASCAVTSNSPNLPVNEPQKPQRKHTCTEPQSSIFKSEQLYFPLKNSKHVHQIAREAAALLAQLISNLHQSTTCALPAAFTVSPIGWIPSGNKEPRNVFDDEVLQRSLSVCSISTTANRSPSSSFQQWDDIWNACQKHADEPWSTAMDLCAAAFVSRSQSRRSNTRLITDSSLTWMDELGLIPEVFIRSHQPAVQYEPVIQDSMLYRQLVELWLNSFVAQRLLCQLRFGESADSTNAETCFSRLLDDIEFVLAAQYECFRHATWSYLIPVDNRWFWTASFLQINLLCRLWPAEFQHIAENLSVLLATCASILVSTKLPIVVRFALQFACRITANWSAKSFQMRSLDALLDWHLTGAMSPLVKLKPPSDGGHSAHISSMGSHRDSSRGRLIRSSVSFMESFVHILSQLNPNLLDWPNELNHLEAAARGERLSYFLTPPFFSVHSSVPSN
ncbi:hypothetical protein EG68_09099 [Paragonimus skrjabini miyazakii]|uniref:GBD/FH3 domain-containing protein n=1 Tax=Paragonimus skrjabini miyazakii TaxID=59628 RepID=A0A8S9YIE6_9TREM|nr:hypothetical protein EG68_09099 [Paragonimus skrjabini miyazakii]